MGSIIGLITRYLSESLKIGEDKLQPDTQIIESGIADSFAIVGLISFVEEKFGISLIDDDFDITNFNSIQSISILIQKKIDQEIIE